MARVEVTCQAGLDAIMSAIANGTTVSVSQAQLGDGHTAPAIGDTAIETPFSPVRNFDLIQASTISSTQAFVEARTPIDSTTYGFSEFGLFLSSGEMLKHVVETTPGAFLNTKLPNEALRFGYNFALTADQMAAVTFQTVASGPASESAAGILQLATAAEAAIQTPASQSATKALSVRRLWDAINARRATQAQAEGGTDDSKLMTPLRVRQALQHAAVVAESSTGNSATLTTTPQDLISVNITPTHTGAEILIIAECLFGTSQVPTIATGSGAATLDSIVTALQEIGKNSKAVGDFRRGSSSIGHLQTAVTLTRPYGSRTSNTQTLAAIELDAPNTTTQTTYTLRGHYEGDNIGVGAFQRHMVALQIN